MMLRTHFEVDNEDGLGRNLVASALGFAGLHAAVSTSTLHGDLTAIECRLVQITDGTIHSITVGDAYERKVVFDFCRRKYRFSKLEQGFETWSTRPLTIRASSKQKQMTSSWQGRQEARTDFSGVHAHIFKEALHGIN